MCKQILTNTMKRYTLLAVTYVKTQARCKVSDYQLSPGNWEENFWFDVIVWRSIDCKDKWGITGRKFSRMVNE